MTVLGIRLSAAGRTNATLAAAIAAAFLVFGLLAGDGLFTGAALRAMAFQMPELGLLSLAMMVTLLAGGINLAVIATANLSALAMAFVLTRFVPGTEGAAWVLWQVAALGAGAAVALAVGLLNGVLIAHLRVSPILATLGTMTLLEGIAVGTTRGGVIAGFPEPILWLGNGTIAGVHVALLLFAAAAVPIAAMLGRTRLGSAIYMIGSSEPATRYSGIDTARVLVTVQVVSSLLAWIAAIVMMARFNSANASYGESYLLVTILAAVLGGIDPMGGFGKVGGLVLALVLLQVVSSGLNLLGISPFLTLAIWGAILLAMAGMPEVRRRLVG